MLNISQNQFPEPHKDEYKVYVRTITYNQSELIENCLNGVAIQQTTFPFVHHVIDDNSTDGEQEVIRAYMDRMCDMPHAQYYDNPVCSTVCAKYLSNQNCTLVIYFLKKNMYGKPEKVELFQPWRNVCKYEAFCEGDDWWINPSKLQLQVEYMDSTAECGLCYTDFNIYEHKSGIMQESVFTNQPDSFRHYSDEQSYILNAGYMGPMTWMLRLSHYPTPSEIEKAVDGTFLVFAHYIHQSKVHYLNIVSAVYRKLETSASHSKDREVTYNRERKLLDAKLMLSKRFGLPVLFEDKCKKHFYSYILPYLIKTNKKEEITIAKKYVDTSICRNRVLLLMNNSVGRAVLNFLYDNRNLKRLLSKL